MGIRQYSWIKFTMWNHVILGLAAKTLILNGNVTSEKFYKKMYIQISLYIFVLELFLHFLRFRTLYYQYMTILSWSTITRCNLIARKQCILNFPI